MVNGYRVQCWLLAQFMPFYFYDQKRVPGFHFKLLSGLFERLRTNMHFTAQSINILLYWNQSTNQHGKAKKENTGDETKYLFPGPHKPQSNLGSRICSSNNISCSPSDRPLLKNMGVGNYSNKAIDVTPHITVDKAHYSPLPTLCQPLLIMFNKSIPQHSKKAYIFTISPSSKTVSSPANGEKWHIVLFTEMHVGNATPLSIFFFTFLYMFPVCLSQTEFSDKFTQRQRHSIEI